MAALKAILLMACAVGAVAILAAALPKSHPRPAANGPAWHSYLNVAAAGAGLDDVTATSRGHAWAVGVSGSGQPLVYWWNGARWRASTRPGRSGSAAASVAASSAANVWVSISGEAALDRWNGHAWRRLRLGGPGSVEIDGLTTTGRKNVWAFAYDSTTGHETAYRYNGRKWHGHRLPVSMGGASSASLASASSQSNVWAWGYDASRGAWVALHYNGRKWRVVGLPAGLLPAGPTVLPEQMLAESASNVWGTVYAAAGHSRGPVVLVHWNGQHWRRVTGRLPAGSLAGPMAPDGHGGLWLAAVAPGGTGFLAHYSQGTWTEAAVPGRSVTVSALTLIPGTRSLWGTGTDGQGPGGSRGLVILRYG